MSSPDDPQPDPDGAVAAEDAPVTEADEAGEPAVDERLTPLLEQLAAHLGDAVVATHVLPGKDAWARVRLDAWAETARVCRDKLGLNYFCYLSAIDWLPSPYGKSEDPDAEPPKHEPGTPLEHGITGGDTRFQLLARLESPATHLGLTLKADLPDEPLAAPTWTGVYAGAQWHEREAREMFGIDFVGMDHPENIYLPSGFEGYPLRKDYPLLARMVKPWPGLVDVEPMPGEPDEDEDAEAAEAAEVAE